MKTIEKIAIDALLDEFDEKYKDMINASISARQAVEIAQRNFKEVATPLMNYAKEAGNILVIDEVSKEAIDYFEEKMSSIIKIPFKVKN